MATRIRPSSSTGQRRDNARWEGPLATALYAELRSLAHSYLRQERPGHTLQATTLVHEVYLRLAPQHGLSWEDRGKFVGVAAH